MVSSPVIFFLLLFCSAFTAGKPAYQYLRVDSASNTTTTNCLQDAHFAQHRRVQRTALARSFDRPETIYRPAHHDLKIPPLPTLNPRR